jgi:cell division protease FtsH
MARFRNQLMKPAKNTFWSRYGRHVLFGVTAAAFAALVTFVHLRHEMRSVDSTPALTGVANDMRKDTSPWTHREKDASELMRDVRDHNIAAIGVSPNAILVSTVEGAKYYVTDHNAAF